ncbi:MAG: SIMPL domain-containing protein [Patescibacteria group bacterium]|nr:SIMPL domain-containing protein [Patescibacteria group bacterium]
MGEQIKNQLKNYIGILVWGSLIICLIFAYAAIIFVRSYGQSISSKQTFTVSAEGKAVGLPDVAKVSFGVISQGGLDLSLTQQENTTNANKIIGFLKSKQIDPKDIQTINYSIEPRYQSYHCPIDANICPPADIVGYTINQTVQVKIRNFTQIGAILSGLVANGANSVSNLSFVIDSPTAVQNQARSEAIAKAEAEAASVATQAGFRLGRLVSIQASPPNSFPEPIYNNTSFGAVRSMAAPAPTIEPGSQTVRIEVTLKYEIK